MTTTKKAGVPAKKATRPPTITAVTGTALDLFPDRPAEDRVPVGSRKVRDPGSKEAAQAIAKIGQLAWAAREAEGELRDAVLDALVAGVGQEPIADALGVTRQAVSQKYSARLAARLLAERTPVGRRGTPASATSSSPPAPRARRRPAGSTSTASKRSRAGAPSPRTGAPKAK